MIADVKVRSYTDWHNLKTKTLSVNEMIKGITKVHKRAFGTPYKNFHMHKWINTYVNTGKALLLVAIYNHTVVGYCIIYNVNKSIATSRYDRYASTQKYGFISNLCSIKRGTGKLLLNVALKHHDYQHDIMLSISRKKLITYYNQFGFTRCTPNKDVMVKYKDKI